MLVSGAHQQVKVVGRGGLIFLQGSCSQIDDQVWQIGDHQFRHEDVVYLDGAFIPPEFSKLNLLPAHPVIHIGTRPLIPVDLSPSNADFNPQQPELYIESATNHFSNVGWGGYLERRRMYEVSQLFGNKRFRDIHLGIDMWVPEGEPIYAPWEGTVLGLADNNSPGDYGPTLILDHGTDMGCYSLLGHLSRETLDHLTPGARVEQGQQIGWVGSYDENGGWPPHLHFQLIRDMLDMESDFPGVCLDDEIDFYRLLCPDPTSTLHL